MKNISRSVNKVLLVGYIATDPCKKLILGKEWVSFILKTPEKLKNGLHEESHNVKLCWSNMTVAPMSLRNGDRIYIEGAVKTTGHLNQNDYKLYKSDIIVKSLSLFNS